MGRRVAAGEPRRSASQSASEPADPLEVLHCVLPPGVSRRGDCRRGRRIHWLGAISLCARRLSSFGPRGLKAQRQEFSNWALWAGSETAGRSVQNEDFCAPLEPPTCDTGLKSPSAAPAATTGPAEEDHDHGSGAEARPDRLDRSRQDGAPDLRAAGGARLRGDRARPQRRASASAPPAPGFAANPALPAWSTAPRSSSPRSATTRPCSTSSSRRAASGRR